MELHNSLFVDPAEALGLSAKEEKKSRRVEKAMKLGLLTLLLAFLIGMGLDSLSAFQKECAQIREDVLRLHILANSDSDADQALKLKVRDRILLETGDLFGSAQGLTDAKEKVEQSLPEIERIAGEVLREEGSSYTVHAKLERAFFDTRVYEGFTMPAGWYNALRVVIGTGEGRNWWCVLYPPLCVTAAEKVPEELQKLSPGEQKLLESEPKYEVRFFVVEVAEKFGNWLKGIW